MDILWDDPKSTLTKWKTPLFEDEKIVELPVDRSPDQVLPELSRLHVQVVSLTPRHESLEDYFVRHVTRHGATAPESPEPNEGPPTGMSSPNL